MKCSFLAICLFLSSIAIAQQITKKELVYGKATDWHNKPTELKLDVFYPANDRKLPLVVFLHGGGFMEGGSREFLTPFCERLSKSGFVVANVDYRTGYEQSEQNYRSEIAKAVYRAQQDEIAAVRFLVHSANEFSIDTSLIFIGGESAGGVASLFTGYVSQEDWDKEIISLHTALGSVDDSGNEIS